jgi:hypothetical protein
MRTTARKSSGPVPTAHTNLVPPASMAAMNGGDEENMDGD